LRAKNNRELMRFMKIRNLWVVLLGLGLNSGHAQNHQTLCDAVEVTDVPAVRKLLAEGASLEARNRKGWTPLIIATQATNTEMVKLLIEKGADVNARSSSEAGSLVLCFATQSDDPKFIELFLQHGARINDRSKNGVTPLYSAVMLKKERAAKFLIAKGARVNQLALLSDTGHLWTPLMNAACEGELHLTELLLGSGASLEKRNNRGDTVLMQVAKFPRPDMLKFLIARGANVNAKNSKGFTALIYAADSGETENVKVLLAAGADPNARWRASNDPDQPGYDATFYPGIHHDEEIVALIREAQKRSGQGAPTP
jgi:ankyrin repeat protein